MKPSHTIYKHHLGICDKLIAQRGFALPTAIMVLFIVLTLSATAVAVSVQSSTSTTRDDNVKAALEAAETGVNVATYRLAMIAAKPGECVGAATAGKPQAPVEGYCKDATESLGNHATFTYWTTPVLGEPSKCTGASVRTEEAVDQRCVTGEGKVNGIARRVQVRVAGASSAPLFPIHGAVGLSKVTISGGAHLKALVGTNGTLTTSGGTKLEQGYILGFPSGVFKGSASEAICPPCGMRSKAEGPIVGALPSVHATATNNEDSRIETKADPTTGTVTWNAANYELTVANKGSSIVLGGSKYYFCKVKSQGGGTITVTASTTTEIFIDSYEDPGSPCKNYGKEAKLFESSGGSELKNSSGDPSKLLIEMYGKAQFIISGGGEVQASVLAPEAKLELSGGSVVKGALLANEVIMSGGSFSWDERDTTLKAETGAESYQRVDWEECTPTGATPLAGC